MKCTYCGHEDVHENGCPNEGGVEIDGWGIEAPPVPQKDQKIWWDEAHFEWILTHCVEK